MNRSEIIHNNFIERVSKADLPSASHLTATLTNSELVDIFETQLMSRLLDIISRRMSSRKQSFYTIGSSGHEGNAIFGKVFKSNDIAFLHYRSCALALQRAKKIHGSTPLYDTMLSFVASSDDPISGGRHKVIGSKDLWIPPQTSTIASHLPKAMGAAHALGLYEKVQYDNVGLDKDSIVLCNFGDASLNHSTAQGALNTAAWASYQLSPMPIIFICEDNGIGISTHTPKGWVEANFSHKPGLKYISCNGLDILDTYRAAKEAERYTRRTRKPVFLHFKTVRLMGHAGSDIEASYHKNDEITATEANDPLLYSASLLINRNIMSGEQICRLYTDLEARITRISEAAIERPKLTSAAAVMDSIWPSPQHKLENIPVSNDEREKLFKKDKRHLDKPVSLSKHINLALADIMLQHKNTVVFGEDVAVKGGVYGVTQGLHDKFGPARVTNTLLDEQSILGLAIGLGHCGFLPIPEIQYLAYFHNAEDQIRGEAASLSFFSRGLFTNPMVVRIAGFAYQKGFGGHFHNDNSFTVFRDIPGIIVATPSNGEDAAHILRICIDLARREQKVVIIIEPIALYGTMDLHEPGDNLWASQYQPPAINNAFNYGDVKVVGDSKDLCILSYANGFYLSNQAALKLEKEHGIQVRLIDIRWLHPLPEESILEAINDCENILIVDECRRSGSVSEAIITMLQEQQCPQNIARINAEDSFIPLGSAAYEVLLSVDDIVEAAINLQQQSSENINHSSNNKRAAS
ncbi:thiamine pyrophosphate-dependent enzyme [Agarilytica rhodophyticola]|uniref:thiamine pyrophosphate-dependent enzyme n=1 Tax=Agarilytica rhodophyticola TaxID=1737490 RepID=UPI000B3459F7|nr:thiamine pyrophosphate-dependent enzyme [Agarilytica rhodophyticola]